MKTFLFSLQLTKTQERYTFFFDISFFILKINVKTEIKVVGNFTMKNKWKVEIEKIEMIKLCIY